MWLERCDFKKPLSKNCALASFFFSSHNSVFVFCSAAFLADGQNKKNEKTKHGERRQWRISLSRGQQSHKAEKQKHKQISRGLTGDPPAQKGPFYLTQFCVLVEMNRNVCVRHGYNLNSLCWGEDVLLANCPSVCSHKKKNNCFRRLWQQLTTTSFYNLVRWWPLVAIVNYSSKGGSRAKYDKEQQKQHREEGEDEWLA